MNLTTHPDENGTTMTLSDRDDKVHLLVRAVLIVVGFLGGCAAPIVREPAAPLQLIGSGTLALPQDCTTAPGAVYRTRFVVQPDGRVADAVSQSGSGCVQDALRQWVSTFVYRPTAGSTELAIDWMDVVAARGG